MSDSLMMVIAIFVAVILMFIFPLLSLSERSDDISQSVVQAATSEFVDKVSISGQIKASDYEAFAAEIGATGNTYDIEIEVQHLDENLGKKSVVTSGSLIGENVRYSTFTSEIIGSMYNNANRAYALKKGDNIIVTVKNTNKTMAQMLRTTFYKVTGENITQVAASASSMVVNTGASN
ncbi:MAG: hypothetical protein IJB90_01880 [Clostridia bacterium]|nr:hypothetical protein [Clostridia bacterium]